MRWRNNTVIFKIFRWFGRNLGSLLLAFLLALVVWVTAVVSTDPNEERTYVRSLDMVGENPEMLMVNTPPNQVRITLEAPRSILDEFSNNSSLLEAWIDLTGLETGEHNLPVKARWSLEPVRLTRVDPAEVTVTLEPFVETVLPVTLIVEGETALGYEKGESYLDPQTVVVSGRQSQVEKVEQVRTILDVAGAGETVQVNVPVVALDADGNPVTDVQITPRLVQVTQPISLLGGFKNVVVKVLTEGQIADGYRLTNISVTPLTVTVFSNNPQLINELPGYVETEPVDLNGLNDDIEIRVNLVLPPGIKLVGELSVLVQVSVAAVEGSRTISLPVETIGLRPDLETFLSPSVVDAILLGPLPVLENLTPESFRVILDLTGLEAGVYRLTPIIDLYPEQVTIESILPETIEVTIQLIPTPTPVPTP
jgi:YbbR domain-containing protein